MSFCRFGGEEIYKDHFKPGESTGSDPLRSSPWPAFSDTLIEDRVTKMMETLTAFKVLCGKCGSGLGHQFLNDGPENRTSRF
uniref:MsrB domain-containing protein n=1 Tax=Poecilia latipinna TaxID=48699 RepID=A0A3B3UB32_9TELE